MLSSYFKIALRYLWKNKTYSFINIAGLSAGISVSILILLFVSHEYGFDRFHKNIDHIYLKMTKLTWEERTFQIFSSPEFGPSIKESYPDVLDYCRMISISGKVMRSDAQHKFLEDRVLFADPSIFSMFSFDQLKGNGSSLSQLNKIILTEEMAMKYFGDSDAIGKSIYFDRDNLFEVVGVVRKAPTNSTIQFNFIASFSSLGVMPAYKGGFLGNPAYQTYFHLRENADATKVEKSIAQAQSPGPNEQHVLEPFSKIHFGNTMGKSNAQYVSIFLCIALFILVLALINYMNLATARATTRAKEVGIRKVSGARGGALSIQFYIESIVTTFISFALALVLVEIFTPLFLNILQQDIDRSFLRSPMFLSALSALLVICVLLSGSYPAQVLPRFRITEVMKGQLTSGRKGTWIRNGFTVFQFSVSLGLAVCSLVVYRQLDFMHNKNIGLDREQVLVIPVDGSMASAYQSLKQELRQQSGVVQVAGASIPLFNGGYNMAGMETPTTHEPVQVSTFTIDENFLETLGIKWRLKPERNVASGNYIINEAALNKLKIAEQPLGQKLSIHNGERLVTDEVVGVLQDFNYTTLHAQIDALVMTVESDTAGVLKYGGSLYVRLNPSVDLPEQIANFKSIFEKYQTEIPFEYFFLDDAFDKLYKAEERLAKVFGAFTLVAIGIACLGLFGLVTFVAERRTKEIGIRKVLGASTNTIVFILSRDFLWMIVVALVISSPLAYLLMNDWLSNFAYRINIDWQDFVIAAVALIAIALATISFRTVAAALANPVKSLRNE